MVDPTFQAFASSFSAIANGLKALKDLVSGDAKAKIIELYEIILSSQANALEASIKQTTMIDRIRELEEELRKVEAWDAQKDRYQMAIPFQGCTVYALKESMRGNEAPHYICANCYQNRKRSILQHSADKEGWAALYCPACKTATPSGYRGGFSAEFAENVENQ